MHARENRRLDVIFTFSWGKRKPEPVNFGCRTFQICQGLSSNPLQLAIHVIWGLLFLGKETASGKLDPGHSIHFTTHPPPSPLPQSVAHLMTLPLEASSTCLPPASHVRTGVSLFQSPRVPFSTVQRQGRLSSYPESRFARSIKGG